MKKNINVTKKAVGSERSTDLHRSLAILQDSIPKNLEDKDEMVPPNMEPLIEKHSEEKEGVKRLDPTRYGDWESKGRCIDF